MLIKNFCICSGRGNAVTLFKTTPKMSVYLLAFVISDFEVITKTSSSATIHRVFARSDAISSANFALDNSILLLNELESYAKTRYELPKMDHAAIPDFAFGNLIEHQIELIRPQ
jgi:aminopeptidase N